MADDANYHAPVSLTFAVTHSHLAALISLTIGVPEYIDGATYKQCIRPLKTIPFCGF